VRTALALSVPDLPIGGVKGQSSHTPGQSRFARFGYCRVRKIGQKGILFFSIKNYPPRREALFLGVRLGLVWCATEEPDSLEDQYGPHSEVHDREKRL